MQSTAKQSKKSRKSPSIELVTKVTKQVNGRNGNKIIFRNGQSLILPKRKSLLGGLKISRRLSSKKTHPYQEIEWLRKDVRILDWASGQPRYERPNVEYPAHWDDNAVTITADKYLYGEEAGTPEYEDSLRHPFDRIANTYTVWGWEEGYFNNLEDAEIFNDELKAMLIRQVWAPNSPVWFNIGHWEQWRWGRPDLRPFLKGRGNKAYHAVGEEEFNAREVETEKYPQCSACFLTEVEDSMEAILHHLKTEGRIFGSGSGVGINISSLRSSRESIAGKGKSSGPISFDRGWDRMAGAIKSGGKTRRAARMVILFSDHPDIFTFIKVKNEQEKIAKIILREHNVHVQLIDIAKKKRVEGTPAERIAAEFVLSKPLASEDIYDQHMDGLLYGDTLANQNSNHTVSLKGDFWKAYSAKGEYHTRDVTDPEIIRDTFKAEELLYAMAQSVWENGEPGQHNNDWINLWNPVKREGQITTSNPCSEYLHLNNTSCNLASFNAYRLLDAKSDKFDADLLVHLARLAMICADLNVEKGGFPTPDIAIGTKTYRTTGIGYANLGGALMAMGIPYDSDEGRWVASQLSSLLTAACFKASAEIGRELGPYAAFNRTKQDLQEVIKLHHCCQQIILALSNGGELEAKSQFEKLWKVHQHELPSAQSLCGFDAMTALIKSFNHPDDIRQDLITCAQDISKTASHLWNDLLKEEVYRNSFVTVNAPTGTISAPLGCYDEGTTSIEPDYSLVKYKQLSGGGMIKMFNRLALKGLHALGYPRHLIREAAFECAGLDGLVTACDGSTTDAAKHLVDTIDETECGPVRRAYESIAGKEGKWEESEQNITTLSKKSISNLTETESLVVNGKGHLEQIPWISQPDLAAFDCSVSNGDGRRSIKPGGHMRMLGAIQPFISGASSKTVNLPFDATIDDMKNCFVLCHEMGVKCIALFRAESKANAVYQLDTPEGRKYHPDSVWRDLVKAVEKSINEIVIEAKRPSRRKLSGRRLAQTVKFDISGSLKGYITVGIYPDGSCGEIFGRIGQMGSFASGMFEAYCKLLSTTLQYGVPLNEIIEDFRHFAFEPSGFVAVGDDGNESRCDNIRSCSSVVDLIVKILDWLFPAPKQRLRELNVGAHFTFDNGKQAVTIAPTTDDKADKAITHTMKNSANICPRCGQMTYIQDGKCRRCLNLACGYKDAGCGE